MTKNYQRQSWHTEIGETEGAVKYKGFQSSNVTRRD